MTVNELRTKFLDHMKERGHAIVPSASLVPENDPTTLFTGSGMQPMLPYLLGQPHTLGKRITDSQRCFRAQDIEEVGDNRHTTFFEMLGNWSFGDYFKEEQITWMWDFVINKLGLDYNNFYITCFKGNDELKISRDTFSAELWQKLFKQQDLDVGIGENPEADGIRTLGGITEHIFYYSEKKNWWSRSGVPANMPIGEPGGPDSEMFYDFNPELGRSCIPGTPFSGDFCHVNCDCGRFMEIGNNVFMQYIKTEHGFEELPQMNVDHGSGLERMLAATNNDGDMFNIDVFSNAKVAIENFSGKKYGESEKITYAYRVLLDHLRAVTFLVCDGVLPGNKDQMYFVRRLIRRSVRYARDLGVHTSFTAEISRTFIESYKDEYPELNKKKEFICDEIEKEENKFRLTLEKGIKHFERIATGDISGENAFDLLQSYGFPIELTEELARERQLKVDRDSFDIKKREHSENSRTASEGKFKGGLGGNSEIEVKYHTATHLLNEALRQVLGNNINQKGSNITTERLRFDFSFDRKITEEEKKKIEEIVNDVITKNLPVVRENVSYDEARARGAVGVFDDKYGDKVSIYTIGERGVDNLFSIEFCGGPHVDRTGDLGHFSIAKEEAVSSGVRRIKGILL